MKALAKDNKPTTKILYFLRQTLINMRIFYTQYTKKLHIKDYLVVSKLSLLVSPSRQRQRPGVYMHDCE